MNPNIQVAQFVLHNNDDTEEIPHADIVLNCDNGCVKRVIPSAPLAPPSPTPTPLPLSPTPTPLPSSPLPSVSTSTNIQHDLPIDTIFVIIVLLNIVSWLIDIFILVTTDKDIIGYLCEESNIWIYMLVRVILMPITMIIMRISKRILYNAYPSIMLSIWGLIELFAIDCVIELDHLTIYHVIFVHVIFSCVYSGILILLLLFDITTRDKVYRLYDSID
jgi:hypothetical protein